jgi:hypothetical protein
MVITHISTFVTVGFYWTSNVVSKIILFLLFSFSIVRETSTFQGMHIVMLPVLVMALIGEEIF